LAQINAIYSKLSTMTYQVGNWASVAQLGGGDATIGSDGQISGGGNPTQLLEDASTVTGAQQAVKNDYEALSGLGKNADLTTANQYLTDAQNQLQQATAAYNDASNLNQQMSQGTGSN
jgi:hypothetical protein